MKNRRGEASESRSGFIALVFISVTLFCCGWEIGEDTEQQKAMDANVGGWEIDAETGERNFVYGIITKEKADDES